MKTLKKKKISKKALVTTITLVLFLVAIVNAQHTQDVGENYFITMLQHALTTLTGEDIKIIQPKFDSIYILPDGIVIQPSPDRPPEEEDIFDMDRYVRYGFIVIGLVAFFLPPFVIASRRYGETENIIWLLLVMFIGMGLLMTPLNW